MCEGGVNMEQLSACVLCGKEVSENSEYCDKCKLEIEIKNLESEIEM
jgi:hypothetical protein